MNDGNVVRAQWPLAKVFKVMPSTDGLVRTVKLFSTPGVLVICR